MFLSSSVSADKKIILNVEKICTVCAVLLRLPIGSAVPRAPLFSFAPARAKVVLSLQQGPGAPFSRPWPLSYSCSSFPLALCRTFDCSETALPSSFELSACAYTSQSGQSRATGGTPSGSTRRTTAIFTKEKLAATDSASVEE